MGIESQVLLPKALTSRGLSPPSEKRKYTEKEVLRLRGKAKSEPFSGGGSIS